MCRFFSFKSKFLLSLGLSFFIRFFTIYVQDNPIFVEQLLNLFKIRAGRQYWHFFMHSEQPVSTEAFTFAEKKPVASFTPLLTIDVPP